MRISDLKVGDRVRVRWHPGHDGCEGVVSFVLRHASRAAGTEIVLDSGRRMRIKASMKIELLQGAIPCSTT